jgi:hypothetical protein
MKQSRFVVPGRVAILAAAAALAFGALNAQAQNSNAPSWNPADPLPKFITHFVIDPQFLVAISKYRSGAGHGYADQYEWPDCSLKNYYQPLPQYLFGQNGQNTLPEYAPANGTVSSVTPDGPLSTGEPRGNQIAIVPDGYPQFTIVLFHVDSLPALAGGMHVNAGDLVGYADLREAVAVDVAVSANWNATPMFVSPGVLPSPGQVLKAPGWRLLSPFDVMSDEAFALYAPYGLTDRSTIVVPLAYRNLHPGQFADWDPANLDPIEFVIFPVAPSIFTSPQSIDQTAGDPAILWVSANATGTLPTIQWYKNGVAIPGATGLNFQLTAAQVSDSGYYWAALTSPGGTTNSSGAILTIEPAGFSNFATSPQSRLVNLSARATIHVGGQLTAGFETSGMGGKSLLLRAVGPTLSQFGVASALPDPNLSLVPAGNSAALLSNAKWVETGALDAATAAVGAFPLVASSADAAALTTLPVGGYTLGVSPGRAADSGTALAEIYDADSATTPATLTNLSALGYSGPGSDTMTAGFVISGQRIKHVLIRAVGPGLAQFKVASPMADPQLALVPQGNIYPPVTNNNWGDNGQQAILQAVFSEAGAFPLTAGSGDAAIYVGLPPGAYTVSVTPATGSGGTVLIEIYDLDSQIPGA